MQKLDPATTLIIDVERKGFPFRTPFPHVIEVTTLEQCVKAINDGKSNAAIKVIVIDSLSKLFENMLDYCRTAYKGYDIYSRYNQGVRSVLNLMRSDSKIFVGIMLPEILHIATADGSAFNTKRAAVAGKEWEGKVEKEFTIVLHTSVRRNTTTKLMDYKFVTNNDGFSEAKSPIGMFDREKEFLVDNDLDLVVKRIASYYQSK
jgi:hypothetical protein